VNGGIYSEWDLHRFGEVGLALGGAGRPRHVASRPGGVASTDILHQLGLLLLM
jgi:hypothetical protein